MEIIFNNRNMLKHIRNTITYQDYSFILSSGDKHISGMYTPNDETSDRYEKIDAHSVFAVAFYYSSKSALDNGDHVLSSIAQYYSIFHLSYALISMDFSIPNEKLSKIRHSQLKNILKSLSTKKVISSNCIDFYEDLQYVREYLNYINVPTGHQKFMSLRRGHLFYSKFYSKDIYISSYATVSIKVVFEIISKYFDLLHDIEKSICSNSKTNGMRPTLFRSIRRISIFDYYGEDFLNNSFSREVVRETNTFLAKNDISPEEFFFKDF